MFRQKNSNSRCTSFIYAALATVVSLSAAFADDTEVFFGQVNPDLDTNPNVMFVLDTSSSMRKFDGTGESRLQRMKNALTTILDGATDVNVGIMRFNGAKGGSAVLFPISPIDKELCNDGSCSGQGAELHGSSTGKDAEESLVNHRIDTDGNVLGIGNTSGGIPQIVGVRFPDINIPQGATITSASLGFTASANANAASNFQVVGELTPDSAPFTENDKNLFNRPSTSASADWVPSEPWQKDVAYESDSVANVLQEIVNQEDWCGGNALSMLITGTGSRSAHSVDRSSDFAPTLKFTYSSSNNDNCGDKTVVSSITSGTDDAEQRLTQNNRVVATSTDLEITFDNDREQLVGLRFTDINIPKGSTVTGASIEFEVDESPTGNMSAWVQGEAKGNPETFIEHNGNISNRPLTNAIVAWDNIPSAAGNEKVLLEGLEPIAQELVDRGDWSSGNPMVFIFSRKSDNGKRAFESYNGEAANAPTLRITYKEAENSNGVVTSRDKLREVVNGINIASGTPIVDAFYESANYFRGADVDYGKRRGTFTNVNNRVSVPESYTGGTVSRNGNCTDDNLNHEDCESEVILGNPRYISPMVSSCQTNHIVLLSDGNPSSNTSAGKVRALTGTSSCRSSGNEACGEELADWLNKNDHSSTINGTQNIITHTIGFNFSSSFLSDIAHEGGGAYYQADSAGQLVSAFKSILGEVSAIDTSFVAPGATVNQFNRLTHRNDIYFALFKPASRPVWSGNLKRYEVGANDSGDILVKDVSGTPAVNPRTGFFADSSQSWWSATPDGNQVAEGGAAAELEFSNANPRKVYTYVGNNADIPPGSGVDLTLDAQALSEDNAAITLEHLGIQNAAGTDEDRIGYRRALLSWARGIDEQDADEDGDTSDWRLHMGDPMHARPVILNYANGDDPKTTVFVGTNEGYLHAVERDQGRELFSYVPKELLENFQVFWNNNSADRHPYGLDGAMSVWMTDENQNVTIDPGEKAFLYTGMRRGGNSYYALNVAQREQPKLAWVIDSSTPGFEELGQTWSKMTPTKIRYNNEELDVLIFAAGYDENQDAGYDSNNNRLARTPDSRGRGVYIVSAETGQLIYSVLGVDGGNQKFDKMDYSMPADMRLLDTNFDGFVDQMYTSDTGGQIWRFDFEPYHQNSATPLIKGGVIADLSGNDTAEERRFYYEPDVAIVSNDGERFLSISIGSGWRAHPLDLVTQDRFHMIKSPDVFNAPPGYGKTEDGGLSYTPIVADDLLDVTDSSTPGANAFGWFYDLGAVGEKVLGPSVTADNKVWFTSYRPELFVEECSTAIGGGSIYALNILDGSAAVDLNGDGKIDEKDRERPLAHAGLPPPPSLLITEKGVGVLAGPEHFDPKIDTLTKRTYWVDKSDAND